MFCAQMVGNPVTTPEPIAAPAMAAVRSGETAFVPKNWEKTYFDWLENIQPWCISRQLWWGHQIPVWYDEAVVNNYTEGTLTIDVVDAAKKQLVWEGTVTKSVTGTDRRLPVSLMLARPSPPMALSKVRSPWSSATATFSSARPPVSWKCPASRSGGTAGPTATRRR